MGERFRIQRLGVTAVPIVCLWVTVSLCYAVLVFEFVSYGERKSVLCAFLVNYGKGNNARRNFSSFILKPYNESYR